YLKPYRLPAQGAVKALIHVAELKAPVASWLWIHASYCVPDFSVTTWLVPPTLPQNVIDVHGLLGVPIWCTRSREFDAPLAGLQLNVLPVTLKFVTAVSGPEGAGAGAGAGAAPAA